MQSRTEYQSWDVVLGWNLRKSKPGTSRAGNAANMVTPGRSVKAKQFALGVEASQALAVTCLMQIFHTVRRARRMTISLARSAAKCILRTELPKCFLDPFHYQLRQ